MGHTELRYFVAAATSRHFAHAAKSLGVPRPTLLATIRALEAELGEPLFDETAEVTTLTPRGVLLLADARRQLDASERAARASVAPPGGKAKASKGKGRAPAVKGERKPGKRRQSR